MVRVLLALLASWLVDAGSNTAAAQARADSRAEIFIYYSPTTAKYFASQSLQYQRSVRRWPTYLRKYGEFAREMSRAELLAAQPKGILILPTAIALDEQEREAIRRFVAGGGNLFATGLVGTRDANGRDTGPRFLEETFNVRTHGFVQPSDDTWFMPFGDAPATWPVPAGRRMPIANTPEMPLLRLSSPNLAAVSMDWSRTTQFEPHGVMALHEAGRSRLAYIAVGDDGWGRGQDIHAVWDATIAWLRRQPQAFKAAWPNGFVASHLMEMDTEDQFHSAPNFADHLEKEGFRGTFYMLTTEAVRHPDIVRDLLKRGHEVAFHGDIHFGFRNDSPEEQELRIRFMRQQMQGILGDDARKATGFRAPEESYNPTTEVLLRKHGVLHHAADLAAHDDRLPFFSLSEPGVPVSEALVVLPRSQMDDVTFTADRLSVEQVQKIMMQDIDLAVCSGAFSLLSVHTQYYVNGALMMRAMGDYVRKVATYRDRLWVARGDEIAQWWRQRELVTVNQAWRDGGLQVAIRNANPADVRGLSVFVTLPGRNSRIDVKASRGTARVKPVDEFRAAVVFDSLPPGDTAVAVSFR
jgi:hypothetical protein